MYNKEQYEKDRDECTVLIWALIGEYKEIIEQLLFFGAGVDTASKEA